MLGPTTWAVEKARIVDGERARVTQDRTARS
jgi:hypothetical protein